MVELRLGLLWRCSINFNVDSTLLCLSSDHGTLHVFALQRPKDKKRPRCEAVRRKSWSLQLIMFFAVWQHRPVRSSSTLVRPSVRSNYKFPVELDAYVPLVPTATPLSVRFSSSNQAKVSDHGTVFWHTIKGNFCVAICADGSYYKYIFDQDGKCSRDTFSEYLEMTDEK